MKLPSSLDRMDIGEMRRRLGNDEDLIADLVGLFLEITGTAHKIKTAIQSGQLDVARRESHTLKGSAGKSRGVRCDRQRPRSKTTAERGQTAARWCSTS